jgi:hypothetical protein
MLVAHAWDAHSAIADFVHSIPVLDFEFRVQGVDMCVCVRVCVCACVRVCVCVCVCVCVVVVVVMMMMIVLFNFAPFRRQYLL